MFRPNYNSQQDLDDYEALRNQALLPPAPPPPPLPQVAPPPAGFGYPQVAPPPAGWGPDAGQEQFASAEAPIPALSPINMVPADQELPGERAGGVADFIKRSSAGTSAGPASRSTPMTAASMEAQPPTQPARSGVDVGPAPQRSSFVDRYLKSLPSRLGNAIDIGIGNKEGLRIRADRDRATTDQDRYEDEQATKYAGRKRFAERQARLDAQNNEDRAEKKQLSAEAKDPTSQKNALFRQSLQKEYPEVWASLSEQQRSSITIEDAQGLGAAMEGEAGRRQASTAATAQERARQNKLSDQKALLDYKKRTKGGGGGGIPQAAVDPAGASQALGEMFGGADKIPPGVKQDLAMAGSIRNPEKRRQALSQILARAEGIRGKNADDTRSDESAKLREENAKNKGELADVKERIAYEKSTEGVSDMERQLDQLNDSAKKAGVDLDTVELSGGLFEDKIPGVGRFENLTPNILRSGDAQGVRRNMNKIVANVALQMSGKATTNQEYTRLQGIAGAADGMDEAEAVQAYRELRQINKARLASAGARYKPASESYKQNLGAGQGTPAAATNQAAPAQPAGSLPPPPSGKIRVRAKDGRIRDIPDMSPEELAKRGLEKI